MNIYKVVISVNNKDGRYWGDLCYYYYSSNPTKENVLASIDRDKKRELESWSGGSAQRHYETCLSAVETFGIPYVEVEEL